MAIHVVNIGVFPVDALGVVINKTSKSTTIGTMAVAAGHEHRVIPDSDIPNSAGYPTIKDYLVAENAGGYKFAHMDQTFIITQTA